MTLSAQEVLDALGPYFGPSDAQEGGSESSQIRREFIDTGVVIHANIQVDSEPETVIHIKVVDGMRRQLFSVRLPDVIRVTTDQLGNVALYGCASGLTCVRVQFYITGWISVDPRAILR